MSKYENAMKTLETVNEISDIVEKAKLYDQLLPFKQKELSCSFCGRPQHKVQRLIAGNHVYACENCIALMHVICEEEIDNYDKLIKSCKQ